MAEPSTTFPCPNPTCSVRLVVGCERCPTCDTAALIGRHYRVQRVIAEGGMGRTLLAQDQRFLGTNNEPCVIKEIKSETHDPRFAAMLQREAGRLLSLRHPNIPAYRDFFEEADKEGHPRWFLVQEHILGDDLQVQLDRDGPFSIPHALDILREVLDILVYIHGAQDPESGDATPILHLDLKPANLIERKSDSKIFLIDFGVAAQLQNSIAASFGAQATILGFTPGYAPFEQTMGYAAPASDLYALCMTFLVLVTGQSPFAMVAPLEQTTTFAEFVQLPPQLAGLMEQMLSVQVKQRLQSADGLRNAIDQPPTTNTLAFGVEEPLPSGEHEHVTSQSSLPALERAPSDPAYLSTAAPEGLESSQRPLVGVGGQLSNLGEKASSHVVGVGGLGTTPGVSRWQGAGLLLMGMVLMGGIWLGSRWLLPVPHVPQVSQVRGSVPPRRKAMHPPKSGLAGAPVPRHFLPGVRLQTRLVRQKPRPARSRPASRAAHLVAKRAMRHPAISAADYRRLMGNIRASQPLPTRKMALDELGEKRVLKSMPTLARMLPFASPGIQAALATALARMGRPALPYLEKLLVPPEKQAALHAARALTHLGKAARALAQPVFIVMTHHDNREYALFGVLKQIGAPRRIYVRALLYIFRYKAGAKRRLYLRQMSRWGISPKHLVGGMLQSLKESRGKERKRVIQTLCSFGPDALAAVQPLGRVVAGDTNWFIRASAGGALLHLGGDAARAKVEALLHQEKNHEARSLLIRFLRCPPHSQRCLCR